MGRGRIVNLAFLGTPEFAVPSLTRLHDAGHDIRLVLTQPDRPSGRGRQIRPGPVKREAQARGLQVFQPEQLDHPAVERIAALGVDATVVVAYGLILPVSVLRLPSRGCINLHASLLPRYRGAAPVAHAILRGETRTGVTTLMMDEGIDTGPILLQRDCPIGPEETAGDVERRLSEMGAVLLVETLRALAAGEISPRTQAIDRETYAPKIRPETARIPWEREATFITNLVRAMNPRPGAATLLGSGHLKIWRVAAGPPRSGDETVAAPGTVLSGGAAPRVACGEGGSVILLEMQMEGRRRVTGEEALRGRWVGPGDRFGEATQAGGEDPGPASPRL
jgi:methionyl-tRNA formyltransferase